MEIAITAASVAVAVAAVAFGVWSFIHQNRRLAGLLQDLNVARSSIQGLSEEMYAFLQLSRSAFADQRLREKLPELGNHLVSVFSSALPYLTTLVERNFNGMVQLARDAAATGTVYVDRVDLIDYGVELVRLAGAGDQIITTSYVKTSAFWDSPTAKTYLREQERVIRDKQVSITRIFLFDDYDAMDESRSQEEVTKHVEAGVTVRTGIASELKVDLRRDMFFISGKIAAEYDMTSDQEEILGVRIWASAEGISQIGGRMRDLLSDTQPWEIGTSDK